MHIEDAIAYKLRRRNVAPKMYNSRRLRERPIVPRAGQRVLDFFRLSSGNLNRIPGDHNLRF